MKCDNICKSFNGKVILDNFCLKLPDTGVVALMSSSGSGKTTLTRIIVGLEKADRGSIICDKKKFSMVFQEDRLIPGVTALENVMSVLSNGDEEKEVAMYWLDKMGIKASSHLLPKELSGGMRRRLAIARAMAYGGDLIVLDEPFAGLDEHTKKAIYPHIFDKSEKNRLTILITHDRQEAELLANRLIVMKGAPLTIIEDIIIK
jgi:NitT/TauT family transport system ATP-binding protein